MIIRYEVVSRTLRGWFISLLVFTVLWMEEILHQLVDGLSL